MELNKWCQPHWDSLREAIFARGMKHLVPQDGEAAASRLGFPLVEAAVQPLAYEFAGLEAGGEAVGYFGGQAQGAGQGKLQAAPQGKAVDGGNARLAQALQAPEDPLPEARDKRAFHSCEIKETEGSNTSLNP